MSNQQSETYPQTSKQVQAEISDTRQRMDHTIDALSARLSGRHVMDEVLGYVRSRRSHSNGDGSSAVKERASQTAGATMHAVVDTIKCHPLPSALIGAGVAWLVYEKVRSDDMEEGQLELYDEWPEENESAFEQETMRASRYPEIEEEEEEEEVTSRPASGKGGGLRQRASAAGHRAQEKSGAAVARGRKGLSRTGARLRQGQGAARGRGRRMARSSQSQLERHPLEVGLLSLAGGLIIGLLTPNPRKVDEVAAPKAREARDRVKAGVEEAVERGKHVATTAFDTAREQVKEQALTPEQLKESAQAVASNTGKKVTDAARSQAEEEGLTPEALMGKAQKVADETKRATQNAAKGSAEEEGVTPSALRDKAQTVADKTKEAARDAAEKEKDDASAKHGSKQKKNGSGDSGNANA